MKHNSLADAVCDRPLAFFVPSMRGGGAERVTLHLARGIYQRGYAVDMVLAQAEGPYLAEIPQGMRVIDLKAKRVLASLPTLVRYLRQEQPAAILGAMNHANIVTLWAKQLARTRTRAIVSEHNTLSSNARQKSRWQGRLMPTLIQKFYPWADGIVAVSQGVAADLARSTQLPRTRIHAIYNPVITPDLSVKANAPLDDPWFAAKQPPVLLGVGRLTGQKDFALLVRAFARVRSHRPVRLLILGEGPNRRELEGLIDRLGVRDDVSLPGFVDNPYAYMARAGAFVLSSQWEGLPTVLIEALYCGTPVISTDCPSGPREILQGGEHGQLVPVGDEVALAEAIEKTLSREKRIPPAASWQPFELETTVAQYLDVLLGKAR